jgi:hypothetical protein
MAKQDALGIYLPDETTEDKLKETYAAVMDKVVGALSQILKNTNISGDPQGGSVEVRRMTNAVSQAYGTARTAAEGDKLANDVVTLNIDTDREIVEEVKKKDLRLHPLEDIISKRSTKHQEAMIRELDTAFFTEVESAATEVTLTETDLVEQIEELIVELETTSNDYVDGVNREDMALTLLPSIYSKLLNYIDTLPNPNEGGVDIKVFHGVRVFSNRRQTKNAIVQAIGSVAQQGVADVYSAERINLSNDFAVSLFYSYGTKAVQEDLILWADVGAEEVSA